MQNIPLEIVGEILRRIPVKSLKRFRCVSKQWCALIDSQGFVKEHLRHSLTTNSNRSLIIGGLGLYTVDLGALERANQLLQNIGVYGISNSCNGLILIFVVGEGPVLSNVFTSEFRVLPPCPKKSLDSDDYYSKMHHGLAYDEIGDDYKVVKVVEFWFKLSHEWRWSEVFIYGLKSNTWKKIEGFPYPLLFLRVHWRAHVNGALHTLADAFMVDSDGDEVADSDYIQIMAFDVHRQKHSCMDLPLGIVTMDVDLSLDTIGGCLSLVGTKSRSSRVVIWAMKEYGVRESWVKLVSIGPPSIEKHDRLRPLAYSKDGGMVLLHCNDKRLVWYDLKKCAIVGEVNVEGIPSLFDSEACVQSLVSLGGEAELKKPNQEMKKKEKLKNKRDDFLSGGVLQACALIKRSRRQEI